MGYLPYLNIYLRQPKHNSYQWRIKMKKLMLLAALGAAAIFTACGDDSSSSGGNGGDEGSCTVTSDETSVTMNQTAMGESYKTIWKIEGDEVVMTQEPAIEGVEPTRTPAEGVTIDILKASAEKSCETFNNAEVTPN